jgi:hypothetical protein
MPETSPDQPEQETRLKYPITELMTDISEYDADVLTRIASLDQRMSTSKVDLAHLMPWAMDHAFMHQHASAQLITNESTIEPGSKEALRLCVEAERSGIAYRVTANPRISWMARLNDDALKVIRQDRVFTARRDAHSFEPNATWLYKKMQSRLLVCIAWMAEGRPMEGRTISPTVRDRIAAEATKLLLSEPEDGI